jgi:hypothetical protein
VQRATKTSSLSTVFCERRKSYRDISPQRHLKFLLVKLYWKCELSSYLSGGGSGSILEVYWVFTNPWLNPRCMDVSALRLLVASLRKVIAKLPISRFYSNIDHNCRVQNTLSLLPRWRCLNEDIYTSHIIKVSSPNESESSEQFLYYSSSKYCWTILFLKRQAVYVIWNHSRENLDLRFQ